MKKNVKMPKNAQYDFTDIFGAKHYHTNKRIYVADNKGYTISYAIEEYKQIF